MKVCICEIAMCHTYKIMANSDAWSSNMEPEK